jgi:hypothetical protein
LGADEIWLLRNISQRWGEDGWGKEKREGLDERGIWLKRERQREGKKKRCWWDREDGDYGLD